MWKCYHTFSSVTFVSVNFLQVWPEGNLLHTNESWFRGKPMQASRVLEDSLRPRLTALSAHGPYPLLCPSPTSTFFSIILTLSLLHCEIYANVSVQKFLKMSMEVGPHFLLFTYIWASLSTLSHPVFQSYWTSSLFLRYTVCVSKSLLIHFYLPELPSHASKSLQSFFVFAVLKSMFINVKFRLSYFKSFVVGNKGKESINKIQNSWNKKNKSSLSII